MYTESKQLNMKTLFLNNILCKLGTVLFFLSIMPHANAQESENTSEENQEFTLSNEKMNCTVLIKKKRLAKEVYNLNPDWSKQFGDAPIKIVSDGNYQFDFFWTDWRPSYVDNNGDCEIKFDKTQFLFKKAEKVNSSTTEQWDLYFRGSHTPFEVKISYKLDSGANYIKRKVTLRDLNTGMHFLEKVNSCQAKIQVSSLINPSFSGSVAVEGGSEHNVSGGKTYASVNVVKSGSFGQPVALTYGNAGCYFGLEYPASVNTVQEKEGYLVLTCSQNIGERVQKDWVNTEWVVIGLTPDEFVKKWFYSYIGDIRVAPVKPYTMYNSWYDLRSVDYPGVDQSSYMNEQNVMRLVDTVRKYMVERNDIHLDAFVLDDGWDIYQSDWELRKKQFANGMKPIADKLKETNTDLGIWFGPTGGYSFKMHRLAWMKEHGYEVTQDYDMTYPHSMLCLAGEKYSKLFEKRVVDFAENDGVNYYKWDGIQFSCSNPDHGHPVGRYSRRATLTSLIDKCNAIRKGRPNMYLNVTSGTWLSPWYVKHANQIWMDGADYAFADVPAISNRDNAITYRDFVLYDDFYTKDLWFPLANLMTHGIIKGKLDHVGGDGKFAEPIDKFADNAVLYFGRGVSMYELYISPDILSQEEWDVLSQSIKWARSRFDVLTSTNSFMIGGNPMNRETYGYCHYDGDKGILAVRNPYIEKSSITVKLDPANGLDPKANSLVLERVYPTRWISPQLYAAGATIELPLDDYETAIYEIYPLSEANRPLVSDVIFTEVKNENDAYEISFFNSGDHVRILNPETVENIQYNGQEIRLCDLEIKSMNSAGISDVSTLDKSIGKKSSEILFSFTLPSSTEEGQLALLLEPESTVESVAFPTIVIKVNGTIAEGHIEEVKGKWQWLTTDVYAGKNSIEVEITSVSKMKWTGDVDVWCNYKMTNKENNLSFRTLKEVECSVFPPLPLKPSISKHIKKLGTVGINKIP